MTTTKGKQNFRRLFWLDTKINEWALASVRTLFLGGGKTFPLAEMKKRERGSTKMTIKTPWRGLHIGIHTSINNQLCAPLKCDPLSSSDFDYKE